MDDNNHPDKADVPKVQDIHPDLVQMAQMLKVTESTDFHKSVSELTTTSERIKFVLSHETVSPVLSNLIAPCDTPDRSDPQEGKKKFAVATQFVQDGSRVFQQGRYEAALVFYSNAVLFAPQDSDLLPLALGNRSGAFFQLKQYESALKDIEAAQSHELYKPYFMLTIRQCQSLLRLGRVAQAKDIFDRIKPDELDKSDVELLTKFYQREKKNLKVVVEKEKDGESKKKDFKPNNLSSVIEILSEKGRFEPHANISSLSSKVEIRYDEKNGRHLVTTQNVHFGDILAVTKPYASVLTDKQELFFCHHCLTYLKFSSNNYPYTVPCTECSRVLYCSEHCRAESWQSYHRFECQLFTKSFKKLFTDNKSLLYLALRTWFVAGGLKSIREVAHKFESDSDPSKKADFTDDPMNYYENVYRLTVQEGTIDELIKAIIIIAFLFKCCKLDEAFDPELKIEHSEKKIYAISILLRHYQQALDNQKAFLRCKESSGVNDPTAFAEVITTLDPQISLLKDSCDPNTSIIVVDCAKSVHASNVCVFFALKPIAAGTVLSAISQQYGDSEKHRIYLNDFVLFRQHLLNSAGSNHACPCEHCQVKRRASALGSSAFSDRDGHELVRCGPNCDGFIRPTDDGRVNCFTCKRVIWPAELNDLKGISRNIHAFYSQSLRLIGRMRKLIKENENQGTYPRQFRTLLTKLETLFTDPLVALARKHSRLMLVDLYKQLNYFYRYCYKKELKFDHLYKAWTYADASHGTLQDHFGGDSLDLLGLLQENVRFFENAIAYVRNGYFDPIVPVAGKKSSRFNSNRNRQNETDESQDMRARLISSFENVQKRLRNMHERFEMI